MVLSCPVQVEELEPNVCTRAIDGRKTGYVVFHLTGKSSVRYEPMLYNLRLWRSEVDMVRRRLGAFAL